eukprot:GFUD01094888.1.p1 GENE.GFUD01094888.1~~GFUD01094888.1.p1  ORF type:complete len:238 (+),score=93.42 GFUD01094888.1:46-759(+)
MEVMEINNFLDVCLTEVKEEVEETEENVFDYEPDYGQKEVKPDLNLLNPTGKTVVLEPAFVAVDYQEQFVKTEVSFENDHRRKTKKRKAPSEEVLRQRYEEKKKNDRAASQKKREEAKSRLERLEAENDELKAQLRTARQLTTAVEQYYDKHKCDGLLGEQVRYRVEQWVNRNKESEVKEEVEEIDENVFDIQPVYDQKEGKPDLNQTGKTIVIEPVFVAVDYKEQFVKTEESFEID